MGRKRIDLRNARRKCHKGGADRASTADQIAVLHTLPYQLLRDDIHHRKTVGNNGMQFPLQPLFYNFRQGVSINFMCLRITDVF